MEEHEHLPDSNRLSVLAATILLAYAVVPFVSLPGADLALPLPFAIFTFTISLSTVVSILVAAMAAVGTDWLLHSHPHFKERTTVQHWLLPALTAIVIGVPLNSLQIGPSWWAVFGMGGLLLVLVFVAEYIVVDFSDARHYPATIGLTALSFALYLILAIALRAADLRLYLLLPGLFLPLALVSLRTLYLRLGGRWCIAWSVAIAVLVSQLALGLHYWPISPLGFGLALIGPAYGLTTLAGAIEEGRPGRTLWVEPAVMTIFFWLLAFVFGR